MSRTTSPQSTRSFSTPSSSRSGNSLLDSTYTKPAPVYPAPVARTGRYSRHRQVASAPASIGYGSGYTVEHEKSYQSSVTSGSSSPLSTHSVNEKSPLLPISGNTIKSNDGSRNKSCDSRSKSKHNTDNAKTSSGATEDKIFDFGYRNVYTTPSARSAGGAGLGIARGRATVGSGSGVGTGMGACCLM